MRGTRAVLGTLMLTVTLVASTTTVATAQGAIRHSGFFFGIGLGPGWAKYGGDATDGTTEIGFSGNLRLGGHLKPNLLLGGETNGWYKSADGLNCSWGSVMGTLAAYPAKSAGFFVKGGLGVMFTRVSDLFDEFASTHFGVQFGAGYDVQIGTGTAITFYGNWIQGFSGALKFDGSKVGDVSPRIIQIGVAFSLY